MVVMVVMSVMEMMVLVPQFLQRLLQAALGLRRAFSALTGHSQQALQILQ